MYFVCRTTLPWEERSYWMGLYSPSPVNSCGCNINNCLDENCPACATCRANYDSWSDGSTETFRAWRDGFPVSRRECGRIQPNFGWVAHPCSDKFKFICERGLLKFFLMLLFVLSLGSITASAMRYDAAEK